jgi:hypothetical protein
LVELFGVIVSIVGVARPEKARMVLSSAPRARVCCRPFSIPVRGSDQSSASKARW